MTDKVRKLFIDRHITSKKAWIICVMQIIRNCTVGVLLLLNSAAISFLNLNQWNWCLFLHIRSPLSEHVKQ